MKTVQKISAVALLALFLVSNSSCKKPDDDGYEYKDNDEPPTSSLYISAETKDYYWV